MSFCLATSLQQQKTAYVFEKIITQTNVTDATCKDGRIDVGSVETDIHGSYYKYLSHKNVIVAFT